MEFWLVTIGAVVVVGTIWFVVLRSEDNRNRKAGTGTWKPYGPNPTDEYIAVVNQARRDFADGVAAYRANRDADAQRNWRDAARDDARAWVGLGLLAWDDERDEEACSSWRRASAHGEEAGQILLRLSVEETSGIELTAAAFADVWLRTQDQRQFQSKEEDWDRVVGVALHFGLRDYATALVHEADGLLTKSRIRKRMLEY